MNELTSFEVRCGLITAIAIWTVLLTVEATRARRRRTEQPRDRRRGGWLVRGCTALLTAALTVAGWEVLHGLLTLATRGPATPAAPGHDLDALLAWIALALAAVGGLFASSAPPAAPHRARRASRRGHRR